MKMFWQRESAVSESQEVIAEPAVVIPVSALPVAMDESELLEYSKVADSLGLSEQSALLQEKIKRFLSDENIPTYQASAVYPYLNNIFGPRGWEWRGVRACDVEYLKGWHTVQGDQRVPFSDRLYTNAIPLPVLLTMKKIADAFPSLYFYVSNPRQTDGDPFLMATTRDMNGFIVERWDEPGFRQ